MNLALQKTLELLLIIAIGVLLQKKLPRKEQLDGVKILILTVALPATIFLALLKIKFNIALIALPLLVLAFNGFMFLTSRYALPFFVPINSSDKKRTLNMLLPSLAPGLSCFPFIVAYLGEDELALAALADVGNKLFVLLILYLVAIHWYHSRKQEKLQRSRKTKLIELIITLVKEPINVVIIVGLIMLGAGFNLSMFPEFIQNTIDRFSVMMVALVLLFIGMAVRINLKDFGLMFKLLSWRSGMAFLFSALIIFLMPSASLGIGLLIIAFPQSACSFWPYAHINVVNKLEEKDSERQYTFNSDFAVSILACSLPFSTLIIIGIFNFGSILINPLLLAGLGIGIVMISLVCRLISYVRSSVRSTVMNEVTN